jgi:CSLREA domain-containing protein
MHADDSVVTRGALGMRQRLAKATRLPLLPAAALVLTALSGSLALGASAAQAAAPTYAVKDLGAMTSYGPAQTPWGNLFSPTGVTSAGAVLFPLAGLLANGTYERPANATPPSSTSTPGSMIMLGINDSNVVIGLIQGRSDGGAAVWQAGPSTDYHLINFSSMLPSGATNIYGQATFVDDAGEIGGTVSYTASGTGASESFVMSSPTAKPVVATDPGGAPTRLVGLNSPWELGVQPVSPYAGFRYNRSTKVRDAPAAVAQAIALSAQGTVLDTKHETKADGTVINLAAPGSSGAYADATTISNTEIAVGNVISTEATAGLWDRAGAFTDLASIGGVSLSEPVIGPSGRIVAIHSTGSSTWDAYLLTPERPPAPVVNSTGDKPAVNGGANGCDTGDTVTAKGGGTVPECTLRAAIQTVNSGGEAQTITFAGPTNQGRMQLQPETPLPPITVAGTVLNFASEGAPVLLIRGYSTGTTVGLDVRAANVTIRGLYTSSWDRSVLLEAPGHDTVIGSQLGSSAVIDQGNQGALEIRNSADNLIGGTAAAEANVLSRDGVGVYIDGVGSTGNKVEGNVLGTDAAGTEVEPDGAAVLIRDASGNTIGGPTRTPGTGAGNLLAGGTQGAGQSVDIVGVANKATGNLIEGNLMGVNRSGTASLSAACQSEVSVAGSTQDTRIEHNVISGECDSEIGIDSTVTSGTVVLGNLIGTDASGTKQLEVGSATYGIRVQGATHTTVGQPGQGNTIAGFEADIGTQPSSGTATLQYPTPIVLPGSKATTKGATSTAIEGNTIGVLDGGRTFSTDVSRYGVILSGKGDLVRRNLIAGSLIGVDVNSATGAETVDGNKLGVDETGLTALNNVIDVDVAKSPHAVIGSASYPNVIYGHGAGVNVEESSDVVVHSNHIGVTSTGDAEIAAPHGKVPAELEQDLKGARAGISFDKTSSGGQIENNTIGGLPNNGVALTLTKSAHVSGNHIGVGHNGTAKVPNKGDGIHAHGATALVIGAALDGKKHFTLAGKGNLIAHNGGSGLDLTLVAHPMLLSNLFRENHDGGIDATNGYPAPDSPTLKSAINHSGHTNLALHESDRADGMLQVFRVPSCGANAEAETLLLSTDLSYAAKGHTVHLKTEPVGTHLIATYTDPSAGTSPYSRCETVAPKGS